MTTDGPRPHGDDPDRVVDILRDLVAIPSVNPRGGAPIGGESAVAEYVRAWATARGHRSWLQEVVPGRHNVLVLVEGRLPGTVVLQTHTDTVETVGMSDPFTLVERDGHCYGRGTCDAKGQLAVFLTVLESLPPGAHHSVLLAACVDEEENFIGVTDLVRRGLPDIDEVLGIVVGEPTELRCVIAHKGVLRGAVTATGPGGHSSSVDPIPNPVNRIADVIAYLAGEYSDGLDAAHPLLTRPTMTVTQMGGGDAINLVPRTAYLRYDRRLIPAEGAERVWSTLRDEIRLRWPDVDVQAPTLIDDGLDTTVSGEFVQRFVSALRTQALPEEPVGVAFGSDASKLTRWGHPCIVFGAGSITSAHTDGELVPVRELHAAVAVLRRLLGTDS